MFIQLLNALNTGGASAAWYKQKGREADDN